MSPKFAFLLTVAALSMTAPAYSQSMHFLHVPGLGHAHCSSSGMKKCDAKPYAVQVVAINDVDGKIGGCAVFFPYNSLTIHTKATGDSATVYWTLAVPTGWSAKFKGKGMEWVPGNGGKDDYPFAAAQNVTVTDAMITMKTDANLTSTQSYGHYPVVFATPPSATEIKCAAGDPVVVNSAD